MCRSSLENVSHEFVFFPQEYILFVLDDFYDRREVGHTAAVLFRDTFRICSKHHAALFSLLFRCFLRVQEVQPYNSTDTAHPYFNVNKK